jgi:hypothetical protein
MKVRVIERDARRVWRWRRRQESGRLTQVWLAWHRGSVDWRTIFRESVAMLSLDAQDGACGLRLACGAGEVAWQTRPWGTWISLRLEKFSPQKQNLVAAALGKAARYHQPEKKLCQP